jgi:hypothetical protein
MTYMSDLRAALVQAAREQHAAATPSGRERATARAFSWRFAHGGRAILASIVLGLAGTAVGAVQVGPPLGPEPPPSHLIAHPASSPPTGASLP